VPGPFTMSQQAQNDFYKDEQEMVLDYAAAVNAEIKDLFAAGADVVQIDEPYMQARPDKARKFGLAGLNAALDGVNGATAVHICFGYAAIIHQRPEGYSFLPELASSPVQQVSIETAQSNLDCAVLDKLAGKTIILGTLDLCDMAIEKPVTIAARIRRALPHVPAERIGASNRPLRPWWQKPTIPVWGGSRERFHRPLGLVSQHGNEYRESFSLQSVASIFAGCRSWKLDRARNATPAAKRERTKCLPAKRPAMNAPR